MGLLDFFGTAFGGSPDQNDLTAQMIAQMGGDPAAMQRQAAMQGLGQLGAAMLANSGPSTTRKSFGQILGAGLQQGMQSFQDARKQGVNQLYIAENVKRAKAQDDEAERKRQQGEALKASIAQVPVAQWPEAMRPYANILTNLPGDQLVDMLTKYNAQAAADARAAKVQEGQDARQQRQFEQQLAMQDRISARSIAAANAPAKAPAWWSMLSPEEQHNAALAQAGLAPKAGGGGGRAGGAVAARTAADAMGIQNALPTIDSALQGLDQADSLLAGGKVSTGMIANREAQFAPSWLNTETQQFLQLAKEQIVQSAKSLPGSFSDKEALLSEAAGLSLSKSPDANKATINRLRQRLTNMRDAGAARLDHYANGGTVIDFQPAAAPAAQGTQPGSGRPAGLPATAQQGQDGNWYDPSTGKRYVYRP